MKELQKENGHTDIAHGIVEALARTYLTSYETRILWVIFRKTYGWQKKDDWIAISQFVEMTGMHKSHVSRSMKLLCERNIVTKRGNKISFNKYFTQWKELPNGVTNHSNGNGKPKSVNSRYKELPNGVTRVTKRGNSELPNGAYTKETPTKETITKESNTTYYGRADINLVVSHLKKTMNIPVLDGSEKSNRYSAKRLIDKLAKIKDKESAMRNIIAAIDFASTDPFWKTKVTSVSALEKHIVTILSSGIERQKSATVVHI